MEIDGRSYEQTATLLGQVAARIEEHGVACYVSLDETNRLPALRGIDFRLNWSHRFDWIADEDQFVMTRSPSASHTDGFMGPFAPTIIGHAGDEDPVLMARAAAAILAGNIQPDSGADAVLLEQAVELLGVFVSGSFLVPFMNALGQAAGQDVYAAVKKRLSLLREARVLKNRMFIHLPKESARQVPVEAEKVEGETKITEPTMGTQLIVVKGGRVDDVARELAKFTPEQIAGKTLVWREDIHRLEISDNNPPCTGAPTGQA